MIMGEQEYLRIPLYQSIFIVTLNISGSKEDLPRAAMRGRG